MNLILLLFPGAGLAVLLIQQATYELVTLRRRLDAEISRDFGRVENIFPKYKR